MRRSRRGYGRSTRPKRERRWTGDLSAAETAVAAGAQSFIALVVPGDYEQSATMEPGGVTLVRIRLAVSLRATIIGGLAYMAVVRIGDNEALLNVNTLQQFISGDVLWYRTVMVNIAANGGVNEYDVDIKSGRKLEADSVVFVLGAVAQTITYAISARCLLLGG